MWRLLAQTTMAATVAGTLLLAGRAHGMEGPRREVPPPDEALVRKVEERVEMLRKWRILEELDPSPELADRLVPMLSSVDRKERELNRERERLLHELRMTVIHESRNESRLGELLDALEQNERERCESHEELSRELRTLLTVQQRARLVVTLEDFHHEVRELIEKVRRPPPEDRPGRPPGD